MNKVLLSCLLTALIMSSCSQNESTNTNSVEIIDLKEAFENSKSITINDISTSFEFRRLETKDECLTGTRLYVYSNDHFLVAVDREKILLFNRKDGKFIREIGHRGNAPGEYSRTYSVMPFDEEKGMVYAGRNRKRYGYSLDGRLMDTLSIPELVSEMGNIDDNVFAAFMPDYQGGEKNKIIVFDHRDSLLNTFPNYLSAPVTQSVFVWNPGSWFYKLDKQLCFYQLFNDTVFRVRTSSLIPEYVFNMGPYSPPYEMKTSLEFEPDKYFMMKTIQESSNYLFCSFNFNGKNYMAIYDKNEGAAIVNDFSPDSGRGSDSGRGFINNINDFVPLEFSSITENDELICTMDAFRIKQWFDLNPGKVNQLPEYFRDLKNIQETGNPVILIAKLKNK